MLIENERERHRNTVIVAFKHVDHRHIAAQRSEYAGNLTLII